MIENKLVNPTTKTWELMQRVFEAKPIYSLALYLIMDELLGYAIDGEDQIVRVEAKQRLARKVEKGITYADLRFASDMDLAAIIVKLQREGSESVVEALRDVQRDYRRRMEELIYPEKYCGQLHIEFPIDFTVPAGE